MTSVLAAFADLLRRLGELDELEPQRVAAAARLPLPAPLRTTPTWARYKLAGDPSQGIAAIEIEWQPGRAGRVTVEPDGSLGSPRGAAPAGGIDRELFAEAVRPFAGEGRVAGDPMPNPPPPGAPAGGFAEAVEAWKRRSYLLYALRAGQLRVPFDAGRMGAPSIDGFIKSTVPSV